MLSGLTQCVGMHRTGVQSYSPACKFRNYKLTATHWAANKYKLVALQAWKTTCLLTLYFFFFLPFPFSLFCFVVFFFGKITQGYRHAGIEQYKTWCLFFFKWNTSLTPYTGVIKPQACRHTGNKTTNVPPHRRNTKLQACRPTGIYKTTSFKLTATQATKLLLRFFFFSFLFSSPHRRSTKLQACCPTGAKKTTSFKLTATQATKLLLLFFFLFRRHTGVVQNYKLAATQALYKLQACCHTSIIQTTSLPPHRRNIKQQLYSHTGNKTTSLPPHRRDSKTTSLLQHRQNKLQTCRLTSLLPYK